MSDDNERLEATITVPPGGWTITGSTGAVFASLSNSIGTSAEPLTLETMRAAAAKLREIDEHYRSMPPPTVAELHDRLRADIAAMPPREYQRRVLAQPVGALLCPMCRAPLDRCATARAYECGRCERVFDEALFERGAAFAPKPITDHAPLTPLVSPRYVVKRGAEAVGMLALDSGSGTQAERYLRRCAARLDSGDMKASQFAPGIVDEDMRGDAWWHLVDTHAPTQAPEPAQVYSLGRYTIIEEPQPAPPTDAEIVAAWYRYQRQEGGHGSTRDADGRLLSIFVGSKAAGRDVTVRECMAAASRVLAARCAASDAERAERARRVVMGPIDDAEFA